MDRRALLDDIELITGKRPARHNMTNASGASRYLSSLTNAIRSLSGIVVGRRIDQPHSLPAFVLDPRCPVAVVREFLGGPSAAMAGRLRSTDSRPRAVRSFPAGFRKRRSRRRRGAPRRIEESVKLSERCGVRTDDISIYEYPVRRSAHVSRRAGWRRSHRRVRLMLRHGLSFVERVGFRYCVDKSLRASAAAVYWRTIEGIHEQRLLDVRADRVAASRTAVTCFLERASRSGDRAAGERDRDLPALFAARGRTIADRLPNADGPRFKPMHRDSCGFPSPIALFRELGVLHWFVDPDIVADKRYCVEKAALSLPTFSLSCHRSTTRRHEARIRSVRRRHSYFRRRNHCFVELHRRNSGPLPEPIAQGIGGESRRGRRCSPAIATSKAASIR